MAALALAPTPFARRNPTLACTAAAAAAAAVERNWPVFVKLKTSVVKCTSSAVAEAGLHMKPLPYPFDALEPYMTKETVEHHWRHHHIVHMEKLNELIEGSEWEGMQMEKLILASYNKGQPQPPFLHAAQTWNHDFFWESMKPGGGGKPTGRLMQLIERDFGSFENMKEKFKWASSTQFGSGWAWLSYKANRLDVGNAINPLHTENDNKLVISKTPNAVNPLLWDYLPLLAVDIWEHAYYLDYENRRTEYVSMFLDKLVAWDTVSSRLEAAVECARERKKQDMEKTPANSDFSSRRPMEMYVDNENESDMD